MQDLYSAHDCACVQNMDVAFDKSITKNIITIMGALSSTVTLIIFFYLLHKNFTTSRIKRATIIISCSPTSNHPREA